MAKACTYSVQFFETKAEVENQMKRKKCLRCYWLISVNCSSDWIRFFVRSIISYNDLFDDMAPDRGLSETRGNFVSLIYSQVAST